jgi:hypothetical protein
LGSFLILAIVLVGPLETAARTLTVGTLSHGSTIRVMIISKTLVYKLIIIASTKHFLSRYISFHGPYCSGIWKHPSCKSCRFHSSPFRMHSFKQLCAFSDIPLSVDFALFGTCPITGHIGPAPNCFDAVSNVHFDF